MPDCGLRIYRKHRLSCMTRTIKHVRNWKVATVSGTLAKRPSIKKGNVMPNIAGGSSAFNFTVTDEAPEIIQNALGHRAGATYTPLAFAAQVVAGTNYCFLCEEKIAPLTMPESAVKVYISHPLGGDPRITEILKVEP